MQPLDSLKLRALKTWRNFSWVVTVCSGLLCLYLVIKLSDDRLPYATGWESTLLRTTVLLPWLAILMQTISVTLIHRLLDTREKR